MSKPFRPINLQDPNGFPIPSDSTFWKMRASKEGGSNITIVAYAKPGTAESDAAWMIFKHTYDSANDIVQTNFAESRGDFLHIYDNSSAVAISGITQANPAVVTATGHGYSNGDEIEIKNVGGMTQVNDKFFLVANVTANSFELQDLDGNNIDSTGYTAYTSGGSAYKRTFANYSFG